jgi:hypothetical protein
VTGPSGPTGPTGASSTVTGPTGPTGPTGASSTVTGPTGPTGSTGAASTVTGSTGPTGPGTMAIGGTVTGGTAGSVLFVAPGPVLAQDNPAFFWNDTEKVLLITQSAADPADGTGAITLQNTLSTSLVQITWRDNTGAFRNALGFSNSAGAMYFDTAPSTPIQFIMGEGVATHVFTADGAIQVGASSAAVGAANTGALAYTTTGQKLQVSANGAAYLDIALLAAPLTAGSIPFSDGSGHLEQDNPNLFWDNTNFRLGIGTNTPAQALDIRITGGSKSAVMTVENKSVDGFSDILFNSNTEAFQGAVGYANASVTVFTNLATHLFLASNDTSGPGPDWVFGNSTTNQFQFGMTTGSAFEQFADGASAAVSDPSTCRLRWNNGTGKLQISKSGAAYIDII